VAYQAEIQIGVKGVRNLRNAQARIERLSRLVDETNKKPLFNTAVVANLNTYNAVLAKANKTLGKTQIELDSAGNAVGNYKKAITNLVRAQADANEAKKITNNLLDVEAQKLGLATQKLKAYNAAAAAPTQRGAATTMTGAYLRGQPQFGPQVPAGFDADAAAARARVKQLAAESIARGKKAKEEIDLVNKVVNEQTEIQRRAFMEINNTKIKFIQTQLDAEIDAIEQTLARQIKADNAAGDNWERRFKARQEQTKKIAQQREADEKRMAAVQRQNAQAREEQERRIARIRKEAATAIQRLEKSTRDAKAKRVKRRKDAAGSAIIGGAFPLLFGQGPLAAAGGAIGGGAGGLLGGQFGFGLSLVGTQFGAIAQAFIDRATQLGQALNPLTADIGQIAEAAGFAGTETELYIKAIEQNAGKQAALKAATEELAAVVGNEGVEALQQFGQATTNVGNAFNQLLAQMSAGIAKALRGVTEELAENLSRSAALQAGLKRTDGPIGDKAEEFKKLRARQGKVTSEQQLKDNKRLRELQNEIITAVQSENRERQRTLRLTKDLQEKLRGIKDQQAQVQTQLEILDITERATQASTEAANLRKQATELITRQEQQIASLRLSLEQQINSIRLQNLSKEAQLRNTQDKLELARLRNRLTQASQSFAASIKLDQPGRDFAISLNKAAADFNLALAAANNERAANDRSNALELEQLGVRAEQTKANVRRQVAKLQADFEKQSNELNQKVADYNRKVSTERFNLEKEITKLRLTTLENELALERLKLENAKDISEKQKTTFDQIQKGIERARLALNKQAAPEKIGPLDLGTPGGVSTEGFDAVIEESKSLIQKLNEARGQLIDEEVVAATQKFTNSIAESTQALVQQETPLDTRLKTMERTAEVARLVAEGFSQADATAIVEGTQAFAKLDEQLTFARENLITLLDGFLALEDKSPEIAKAIEEIQKALGNIDEKLEGNKKGVNDFVNSFDKTNKIKNHIDQLKKELEDTEGMIVSLAQTIEGEIGSAMSTAITNVITGTGTVQEAMSTMFANIGKAFIDMATQMIAKALILKALGVLFPGASGFSSTGYYDQFTGKGTAGPNFGLADGGPTRPNGTYLVGERGPELLTMGNQPGYVHRNTSEVMDRYRGGESGGGAASNVSVNYNVTEINEMRFVTEDQFRAGMVQAARDGARRGEASTFRTLRNSRSNRARVGL